MQTATTHGDKECYRYRYPVTFPIQWIGQVAAYNWRRWLDHDGSDCGWQSESLDCTRSCGPENVERQQCRCILGASRPTSAALAFGLHLFQDADATVNTGARIRTTHTPTQTPPPSNTRTLSHVHKAVGYFSSTLLFFPCVSILDGQPLRADAGGSRKQRSIGERSVSLKRS